MSYPPPAGWFPDPSDPRRLRWWDSRQWTDHLAAYPPVAPYGYPPAYGVAPRERSDRWLLPVGRSGLALAAGYLGLFSIVGVFAPISIVVSILALQDLKRRPQMLGRGRAVFGLVMGCLFTLLVIVGIASNLSH